MQVAKNRRRDKEGTIMVELIDELQFINQGDQIRWDLIGFGLPRGRWGKPNHPKFELAFGRKTSLYVCNPKLAWVVAEWESVVACERRNQSSAKKTIWEETEGEKERIRLKGSTCNSEATGSQSLGLTRERTNSDHTSIEELQKIVEKERIELAECSTSGELQCSWEKGEPVESWTGREGEEV